MDLKPVKWFWQCLTHRHIVPVRGCAICKKKLMVYGVEWPWPEDDDDSKAEGETR